MQHRPMIWLVMGWLAAAQGLFGQSTLELRDGDRVLFVGDTLIERAQRYGYWERNFTARFPDRHILFRNLGWSADTPRGKSRASFDWNKPPSVWFEKLRTEVERFNPTLVFLGYGMASSFDGLEGLPAFRAEMGALMDAITNINSEVRFVVLSPVRHEALGGELPDPAPHNEQLAHYTQALRELARERGAWFVSLFNSLSGADRFYTENGIHLSADGYRRSAAVIERELGWQPLDLEQTKAAALESLREAIVHKNELFFHRWRPQNSTYLFLFRKHEQGQNAREIPMFDSLIAMEEERISRLRHLDERRPPAPAMPDQPEWQVFAQDVGTFQTDPLLQVELFAENPILAKPIHMNFDGEGRLWVASSSVYPQIEPGQIADDKILVLEDSDGDGRVDRSTVFADGLLIPTGVLPGDGGVYVGQSTELLFLRDTDGDGRADEKRVVLSAFGTEDTHHILHTLRWGFDGRLYMNQSIYIHTHVETPHGVVRLNSGGILSLRPSTLEMGIFMKGLVNSWGHVYDRWGQSFATDGAGTPEAGLSGITYVVPGAMYHTYAGARRILGSVSPGSYPKFCSLEILQSEHFPDSWQGNLVTCDFRANRVVRFQVEEKGSAYVATEMPLFLRSTNVTFRPIDVKLGPDGALYVADWSNPIIQHGEVDFRDPRRDHVHGRIWRVTMKDKPPVKRPLLVEADTSDLLAQLLSPNLFNQEKARRVLTERGRAILPALSAWSRHPDEAQCLQALWVFQSLNVVEERLLNELLEARDPRVRAAATRVLGDWQQRMPGALPLLAARIADEHPRVRMESARALSRVPSAYAAELVLSAVDRPLDTHLEYALWLSINELAEPWINAIRSGAWALDGREKQLEFGLNAIEPSLASEVLGQLTAGKTFARDGSGPWVGLIGKAGGPPELRRMLDVALEDGFAADGLAKVLQSLEEAARVRAARPSGDLTQVLSWLDHADGTVQQAAARLVGRWKLGQAVPKLLELAERGDAGLRRTSFGSLRDIGGGKTIAGLRPLTEAGHPLEVRQEAALAWAALDLRGSARRVVELLGEQTDEDAALALWRGLLGLRGAARVLADALPSTGLSPVLAKTGLRAAREGGRNEPELVLALSRGADLDEQARTLTEAELKALAEKTAAQGRPAHGELVYRRAQLSCTTCHAIGGVGGKVGPDLTSIGASAQLDYLIESMLYPNRKVKEGYHSIVIETKDGEELSGILVRETSEQLFVRDVQNQEVAVAKNNVLRRTAGNSLMPTGLVDYLSEQERLDLFKFLSELGKPGPFDATQGTVARYWRLAPATIDLVQFGDEKVLESDLEGRGWWPGYSLADGRLPRSELETAINSIRWRDPSALYAAARLDLGGDQSVQFRIDAEEAAPFWVDGQPAAPDKPVNLTAGTHTIIIKMDARRLPEQVRLEASAGTFLVE